MKLETIVTFLAAVLLACGLSIAPNDEQDEHDGATAVDRRNPREIRRASGRIEGPRMTGSGVSIGDGDDLDPYKLLEPLIGTFTFQGQSWRTPGAAEPNTFAGTWTNSWELDGYFMKSQFIIEGGDPEYVAMGHTWWESRRRRYESHFYNSRGTLYTQRFGGFDEAGDTLVMLARHSRQPEDEKPESKFVYEIKSDNEFTYSAYQYRAASDDWWKTFEMTCTRSS